MAVEILRLESGGRAVEQNGLPVAAYHRSDGDALYIGRICGGLAGHRQGVINSIINADLHPGEFFEKVLEGQVGWRCEIDIGYFTSVRVDCGKPTTGGVGVRGARGADMGVCSIHNLIEEDIIRSFTCN